MDKEPYIKKRGDTIDTQKEFKRIGTHDGLFHADEVMATAILKEIFEVELTRTRDSEILQKLDIVYDVGGGEFDHHDMNKSYRKDGIPFAACGLIWSKFGRDVICSKDPSLSKDDLEAAFNNVDRVLIEGIDALDNGVKTGDTLVPIMSISSIISGFNPPWYSEEPEDEAFSKAVEVASTILQNAINRRFSVIKSRGIVRQAYKQRKLPQLIVLDTYCPWSEPLQDIDKNCEVLFVIYPRKDSYAIQTVRGKGGEDLQKLPEPWAGKRDEELAAVTGVPDSIFCHTGRFIAVARSFEGVLKMAQIALKETEKRPKKGLIGCIKKLFH
jgi:uncharacterized UPF0160 family protein